MNCQSPPQGSLGNKPLGGGQELILSPGHMTKSSICINTKVATLHPAAAEVNFELVVIPAPQVSGDGGTPASRGDGTG